MALHFRLSEFEKCGPIGVMIKAIITLKEVSEDFI
jgi:hypothetical protein